MRVIQTQQSITSTPKQSTSALPHAILSAKRKKRLHTFENDEAKKRRRKPGTVALRQIKFYQKTTDLLLRALPFARVVKEVGDTLSIAEFTKYKWKQAAIEALQHAAEAYMVALFEDVNKAAIHAKRVTVRPEDLHIVRNLRSSVNANEIF